MPPNFGAGETVNTTAVMQAFVTRVRNLVDMNPVYWDSNRPAGFPVDGRLGPQLEPAYTWPTPVSHGQVLTTNMFYILHQFAVRLTRIRRGRFILKHGGPSYGNGDATSFAANDQLTGFVMVAYNNQHVIGFNMPSPPNPLPPPNEPPYPFDANQMNTFLDQLRIAVTNIKNDNNFASDFTSCHNNCHSNCHGSRGRR